MPAVENGRLSYSLFSTTGDESREHEQHHQLPNPVRPGIRFSICDAQCPQRCFVAAAASPSHCSHSVSLSSRSVTILFLVSMAVTLAPVCSVAVNTVPSCELDARLTRSPAVPSSVALMPFSCRMRVREGVTLVTAIDVAN